MTRLWQVARREYLTQVRTKGFIIGTVLGPVLMAALMFLPSLLMLKSKPKPLHIVVLDDSGQLQEAIEKTLTTADKDGHQQTAFVLEPRPQGELAAVQQQLDAAIREGRLDGFVVLQADVVETSKAEYRARNVTNFQEIKQLEGLLSDVVKNRRLRDEGLDTQKIDRLTRRIGLSPIRVTAGGAQEDRGLTFVLAMFLMMMIYMPVLMWGSVLMNGVIEEKTSRVVEMVVSSVSPFALLGGKVLGIGAAGLTQLSVWLGCTAAGLGYGAASLAAAGVHLPALSPLVIVSFAICFLLGYFLYSLLFAAVGAAVNSLQEAQSLVMPISLMMVVGFVSFPVIMRSPDGVVAVVLSLIPFFTPLTMFLRITIQAPPLWQIALSFCLTFLTIVGVTWLVARIYRVGILMYGKKPNLPEILRWVRTA